MENQINSQRNRKKYNKIKKRKAEEFKKEHNVIVYKKKSLINKGFLDYHGCFFQVIERKCNKYY